MSERIWDRFLTAEDKAHLVLEGDRRVGFGSRPALLMIDLYRWAFGDEPELLSEAMKKWPGSCGQNGWNALPHIRTLLAAAREATVPVIHVTMRDASDGVLGWHEAVHRLGGSNGKPDPEMQDRLRRKTEIIEEVAPLAGEAVIRKSSPSPFWGTPLTGHLQYLNVDTLLVAGERTSGCVRAAVVDGTTNRFRMVVVEDCVFDRYEAAHAMSLFDIHLKYGDVVPLQQALGELRRRSPD